MGIFDDLKAKGDDYRFTDKDLYAEVLRELEAGSRHAGLWAQALADSNMDQTKAGGLYITLRLQALRDEIPQFLAALKKAKLDERQRLVDRAKLVATRVGRESGTNPMTPAEQSENQSIRKTHRQSTWKWLLGAVFFAGLTFQHADSDDTYDQFFVFFMVPATGCLVMAILSLMNSLRNYRRNRQERRQGTRTR